MKIQLEPGDDPADVDKIITALEHYYAYLRAAMREDHVYSGWPT